MPATTNPGSAISKHDAGLLTEAQDTLSTLGNLHRSRDFNRLLIPSCRNIVEAIGHRLAYDAAVEENVDPCLLRLYECDIIGKDIGWYIQNGIISSQSELRVRECLIADFLEGRIGALLDGLSVQDYARAPIVSDSAWALFMAELPLMAQSMSSSSKLPAKL